MSPIRRRTHVVRTTTRLVQRTTINQTLMNEQMVQSLDRRPTRRWKWERRKTRRVWWAQRAFRTQTLRFHRREVSMMTKRKAVRWKSRRRRKFMAVEVERWDSNFSGIELLISFGQPFKRLSVFNLNPARFKFKSRIKNILSRCQLKFKNTIN